MTIDLTGRSALTDALVIATGRSARHVTALAARTSKAATVFRDDYVPPSRHFSVMRPPVWTVLDGRRNTLSATFLRRSSLADGAHLW